MSTKKENTIIAILSIVTVLIGMLIMFIESIILVRCGIADDVNGAMIISLYSGFLLWVIIAATLISPAIIDKLFR